MSQSGGMAFLSQVSVVDLGFFDAPEGFSGGWGEPPCPDHGPTATHRAPQQIQWAELRHQQVV
jgi:hypothetical protein